jgi:hypothetical protein
LSEEARHSGNERYGTPADFGVNSPPP